MIQSVYSRLNLNSMTFIQRFIAGDVVELINGGTNSLVLQSNAITGSLEYPLAYFNLTFLH